MAECSFHTRCCCLVYVDVPQGADPQTENKRFVIYKLIQDKKC